MEKVMFFVCLKTETKVGFHYVNVKKKPPY